MEDRLISVIICTYNEKKEEFIQAVNSILTQTYQIIQLIIVLDNPENLMLKDLAMKYAIKDKRVLVLVNEVNLGVTGSTNRAVSIASGEFIAKMDADDVAMPERLQIELTVLMKNKLDLVAASKRNIDQDGRALGDFVNKISPNQMKLLLPYDNLINQSTVLMKKKVLNELGGYRNLPSCEDYDLWIRMLGKGYRMEILPDILVDYRVRKNSITRTDYHKQYISECFVRRMFREYKKNGFKYLTLEEFENYNKEKCILKNKKRFNYAYGMYYKARENRKKGELLQGMKQLLFAISMDFGIAVILLRKIKFHIIKKMVLSVER